MASKVMSNIVDKLINNVCKSCDSVCLLGFGRRPGAARRHSELMYEICSKHVGAVWVFVSCC